MNKQDILNLITNHNTEIDKLKSCNNEAYTRIREIMIANQIELINSYVVEPSKVRITGKEWTAMSADEKRIQLYGINAWQVLRHALIYIQDKNKELHKEYINYERN